MRLASTSARPRRAPVLAAALLCLSACGDVPSIPVEDVGDQQADALCGVFVDCSTFPDIETCRASLSISNDFFTLLGAVNRGTVLYNGALAAKCVGLIDDLECTQTVFSSNPFGDSACESTFRGTVAIGDDCWHQQECRDGGACEKRDTACDAQTTCCVGGCQAPIARVPIGGDCLSSICVEGAFCKTDAVSGARTCTAKLSEGETCTGDQECGTDMLCLGTTPATTCKFPPDDDELCPDAVCSRRASYCDPADTICKPRVEPGQPCITLAGGMSNCVGYAVCDATTTMCVARPRVGEVCVDGGVPCMGQGDVRCDVGTLLCTLQEDTDPICPL